MSEDNTQKFYRTDDPAGGAQPMGQPHRGSTIFNTSVRGWIALIIAAGLTTATLVVTVAPLFSVAIPTSVEGPVFTLFGMMVGSVKDYFGIKSREGQSEQPSIPPVK